MAFTLPKLSYEYSALEPYIDAQTMEIHHSKHHQTYVNNLNNALTNFAELQNKPLEKLIADIKNLPADIKNAVRNNGGGHWNHTFFWDIMTGKGTGKPVGKLGDAIIKRFGSFERLKEDFTTAALGRFGSGWAWLIMKDGELQVVSTPNQDNPLMDINDNNGVPIIALDVWEHAYYLKYQNRRPEYVNAWWSVVNWEKADSAYSAL